MTNAIKILAAMNDLIATIGSLKPTHPIETVDIHTLSDASLNINPLANTDIKVKLPEFWSNPKT